jgi:outer membrane protein
MTPVPLLLLALTARTVTLEEAERAAETNHPEVRQARANTEAGVARVEQARAPALPQVKAQALYERTTGNREQKPGRTSIPGNPMSGLTGGPIHNTFDTYNWWDGEITANWIIWDFGQTLNRWRAAEARAASLADSERATRLHAVVVVRAAFFGARAQKALAQVARDTLANQERHLAQIQGFVQAGTRPEIDLAQARADRATAKLLLIRADNAYAMARANLNQAMGVTGGTDYDVADQSLPAVEGEGGPIDKLIDAALAARPEIAALDGQIRAQQLTARAARGAYFPTLSLVGGATDAGVHLVPQEVNSTTTFRLAWNFFGGLQLNWLLFQGFLTRGQVREADATAVGLLAQRDGLVQQIWVAVQEAALGVQSAKEALAASDEALANARERLRLAEGRYAAGAGNIIELGDAQVAASNAAAQRVGAEYALAAARAELTVALGRR